MSYNTDSLKNRILVNSNIKSNGCWEWNKYISPKGYGEMPVYKEKMKSAHRWAYKLFYNEDISGKCVCHKCDNPTCVNPEHLFLGSQKDNILDMHKKGRWCDRNGEKHPRSKLTDKEVVKIKKMYKDGNSQSLIAKCFGINQGYVSKIVNKKRR